MFVFRKRERLWDYIKLRKWTYYMHRNFLLECLKGLSLGTAERFTMELYCIDFILMPSWSLNAKIQIHAHVSVSLLGWIWLPSMELMCEQSKCPPANTCLCSVHAHVALWFQDLSNKQGGSFNASAEVVKGFFVCFFNHGSYYFICEFLHKVIALIFCWPLVILITLAL